MAVNILLMLALSYTPVAPLGLVLFSNYIVGIAVFVVNVGGGIWVARKGLKRDSPPIAGAGVTLAQAGFGLIGSAILLLAPTGMRVAALGIAAVVTGLITAVATFVVFNTDRSFERWQTYAGVFFIGGFAIGALGVFTNPILLTVAGVFFFLCSSST